LSWLIGSADTHYKISEIKHMNVTVLADEEILSIWLAVNVIPTLINVESFPATVES
jgi:hypothetical protein